MVDYTNENSNDRPEPDPEEPNPNDNDRPSYSPEDEPGEPDEPMTHMEVTLQANTEDFQESMEEAVDTVERLNEALERTHDLIASIDTSQVPTAAQRPDTPDDRDSTSGQDVDIDDMDRDVDMGIDPGDTDPETED